MAKKKEIIKEEIIKEEPIKEKPKYTGDLRGFKTVEQALDYPNTDAFKKLDIGCRTEYLEWLKNNILKEE